MARRWVVLLAVVLVLVGGGGLVVVASQPALTLKASPVTIDGDVAADAGFTTDGARPAVVNRTVEVDDYTGVVRIRTQVTTYQRRVETGDGDRTWATVGVVSVPTLGVADLRMNPLGDYDGRDFGALVDDHREIEATRPVAERAATLCGRETTLVTERATVAGGADGVRVAVATVPERGGYLTFVAVYPPGDDTAAAVERMRRGVDCHD